MLIVIRTLPACGVWRQAIKYQEILRTQFSNLESGTARRLQGRRRWGHAGAIAERSFPDVNWIVEKCDEQYSFRDH